MPARLLSLPNMVEDVQKGTVLANPGLALLEGGRVVMRRDQEEMRSKVKLMSGGGSGHEPWPAGYVGVAMLTAAVVGDAFTAPPPHTILRTIRHLSCDHFGGILIIVRNATGNRLNFATAIHRALEEDINVRMLIVGEDAPPSERRKTLRNIDAAIVLCKIAGAMSENGCPLDEIFHLCQSVATKDLTTIATCLEGVCPVVFVSDTDALYSDAKKQPYSFNAPTASDSPRSAVRAMLKPLFDNPPEKVSRIDPEHALVILIDNAGHLPKLEENLIAWETLSYLGKNGYVVTRAYCGTFFASPDAAAFSVTLLRVSFTCILTYLDAPTTAQSWPRHLRDSPVELQILPANLPLTVDPICDQGDTEGAVAPEPKYTVTDKFASCVLQVIECAAKSLIDCEKQLNTFDEFGGGRDCGKNTRKGARAIEKAVTSGDLDGHNLFKLFRDISGILESVAAGSTGGLYAIFFEAAAKAFRDIEEQEGICELMWLKALELGTDALYRYSCIPPVNGTLVDAFVAAVTEWQQKLALAELFPDWTTRLDSVVKAAENAALLTALMRPDTNTTNVPDPGAHAVGVWLRTSYEVSKMLF